MMRRVGIFCLLACVVLPGAPARAQVEVRRLVPRHGEQVPYVQRLDRFVVPGTAQQARRLTDRAGLAVQRIAAIPDRGVCLLEAAGVSSLADWRSKAERLVAAGAVWVGPAFFDGPALTLPTGRIWVFLPPGTPAARAEAILAGLGLSLEEIFRVTDVIAVGRPRAPSQDVVALAGKLARRVDAVAELMARRYPYLHPQDTFYHRQWRFSNSGDNVVDPFGLQPLPALTGADIQAEAAWDGTTGDATTIVAVIDTGVACNHPELSPKCLAGLNAITGVPDASPPDPSQDLGAGHGTAVASIAVAPLDDQGIVGVCPGCSLVPVRLIEWGVYLTDAMILRAYQFAVDSGAAAINNSWGPTAAGYFVPVSTGELEGMRYALNSGRGGLGTVVVYAAGNENQSTEYYGHLQTGLPNVMAVAATDQFDTKAEYSNYGAEISLAAPSSDGFLGPAVYAAEIPGNGNLGGDYTSAFGGTSGAAPVVSGLAALVIAANPDLTAAEVVQLLEETADKVDPDGGRYDANGHSVKYGYGRVNAARAVLAALGEPDRPWCDNPAADEDCDLHRDDDCDSFVDEGCTLNPTTGTPCTGPAECGNAPYWECPSDGKSRGLCTWDCTVRPCSAGTACVDGVCLRECASDDECEDGFVCSDDLLGVCLPACTSDGDCGQGEYCDPNTHLCRLATDGEIGSPCQANEDCKYGGFCLSEMMGFPGGYCTTSCSTDQDCGGTNKCVFIAQHGNFCYRGCSRDGDCRPGYVCEQAGPRAGTCYKHCSRDDQCTGGDPAWAGIVCDQQTGRCVDEREPDAGVPDAAVPDGAPSGPDAARDAAVEPDIYRGDAGFGPTGNGSGCDCRAADSGTAGWPLVWILPFVWILRRRRGGGA